MTDQIPSNPNDIVCNCRVCDSDFYKGQGYDLSEDFCSIQCMRRFMLK